MTVTMEHPCRLASSRIVYYRGNELRRSETGTTATRHCVTDALVFTNGAMGTK